MADIYYIMSPEPRRLAVLIDGDFVEPELLGRVLAEASRHGTLNIRRIYGNREKLSDWKECIRRHGIEPVPNYASGGNAADITLIIDTMDMLNSGRVDGFCIVASDNHFAGLASRIHKEGIFVVGIGSSDKPPSSFKGACDDFRYVEDLPPSPNPDPVAQEALAGWKEAVKEAVRMSAREDGWALLSDVGNKLKGIGHDFDYRVYCHGDLLPLVKSCPEFEAELDRVRLRSPKTG